ncbi:MAG: hypothetical protein M9913_03200 [Bryobacteraceae bacterium]|nr:hypothetical protein [Solibacteraceae bacterium]MCO5349905.1 hypothetical protein [Bryobacteraceae bacterium]
MKKWTIAALTLAALVAGLAAVTRIAGGWWEKNTLDRRAQLESARPLPLPASAEPPAVVQRYLEMAAPATRAAVRRARLQHEGEFLLGPGRWKPFSSTQLVSTNPPGFDWDARMPLAPGLPVFVRDGYQRGEGEMRAAVFGLFIVARVEGGAAMAEGQLLRYLAETPWYPTALRPGGGVEWEALTDSSARARLKDGPVTAVLDFEFGPDGLISGAFAAARGREVDGRIVMTPWAGRFRRYEKRDGMLIPVEGEVEWRLPEGPQVYWKGRVTGAAWE